MAVPVLGLIKKASLNDVSESVFCAENVSWACFFLWWPMIVITRKKALEKQHILIKTFLDIISPADQRRKKNYTVVLRVKNWSRNSNSTSLSLWDPKPVPPWPIGKNEDLSSVLIFYDYFLASHNSRKFTVRPVFHELSNGVTRVSLCFSNLKIILCKCATG